VNNTRPLAPKGTGLATAIFEITVVKPNLCYLPLFGLLYQLMELHFKGAVFFRSKHQKTINTGTQDGYAHA